jgi:hypothetical protein
LATRFWYPATYFRFDVSGASPLSTETEAYKAEKDNGGEKVADKPQAEQNVEQQIQVRQVTDVHANWNEEERGAPGKFSFQLILDNGAEEYAIRPPAEDADVLMDLFSMSGTVYFDLERKVLIFGTISLGG